MVKSTVRFAFFRGLCNASNATSLPLSPPSPIKTKYSTQFPITLIPVKGEFMKLIMIYRSGRIRNTYNKIVLTDNQLCQYLGMIREDTSYEELGEATSNILCLSASC